MYIFDLLKKITKVNDSLRSLKTSIVSSNEEGSEDIENTTLKNNSLVYICNKNIDKLDESITKTSNIKESISNSSILFSKVLEDSDNHYMIMKNVSEVYQFSELLSYSGQKFKHNDDYIPFISKENINGKEVYLFNSMISSDNSYNNVIIYKTTLNENGSFSHESLPFISNNGFYKFMINLELEKVSNTDTNTKYRINDKNGLITVICYQNSIWEG